MSIELNEKTSVGVWFIPLTDKSDFMLGLTEPEPGTHLLQWRFRYYGQRDPNHDNMTDAHYGSDTKNWYRAEAKMGREQVLASVRDMAGKLAEVSNAELHEILHEGDFAAFMDKLINAPWAHALRAS